MRICQRQNKLALWGAAESAHSKIESMKSSRPMREEQPSPEHSASLTHSASATSVASFSSHTSTIALYSLRLSDMYCALDMNITSLSLPLAILSWRWAVSHQTCNACLTCGASRSASRCSTADDVFIDSRPCKWKGTNDVEDCLSRTSWLLRKSFPWPSSAQLCSWQVCCRGLPTSASSSIAAAALASLPPFGTSARLEEEDA